MLNSSQYLISTTTNDESQPQVQSVGAGAARRRAPWELTPPQLTAGQIQTLADEKRIKDHFKQFRDELATRKGSFSERADMVEAAVADRDEHGKAVGKNLKGELQERRVSYGQFQVGEIVKENDEPEFSSVSRPASPIDSRQNRLDDDMRAAAALEEELAKRAIASQSGGAGAGAGASAMPTAAQLAQFSLLAERARNAARELRAQQEQQSGAAQGAKQDANGGSNCCIIC